MRSAWPAGGVKLRVRTRVRWGSNAVAVGGRAWAAVNATEQTILFAEAPEGGAAQDIVVLMPAAPFFLKFVSSRGRRKTFLRG